MALAFTICKNLFKTGGHYGESKTSKTRNSFAQHVGGLLAKK